MFAQNVWTGSSSGVINVSGNYQAGASVANDGNPSAAFVFGRVASTNRTITLPGEFKANQLQFESNGGGGFTLSGSFLNFIGGSNGIFQNSSQAVTISSGIKVSDGPLTLGGTGTGLITLSGSSGNDFGGKGITKSGTSAFLITQSLTNTGTLNINGGTLAFSGTGNIARAYQLRGGVVATSGTFSRALGTTATNVNFGAGGGGFAAYGGALTVSTALGTWASTANSLANNTSLILGSNIANNVVTLSSNLNLNAAARTIQLVDNANSADDWSVMSGILSNGGLRITGSGRLVLSGTNTFTGVTSINGGTLSVATIGNGGTAGNLGQAAVAAGNLVLGGGTLQYTGATASTDRSFTLTAATSSSIHVTEAANALTISGASANTTGALTKTGAGTLILSGLNLHTGLTTVSNGTLRYGITNALSSGGVTVSGGTLDIATFNDTVGAVSVESGSITGTTGALTGTSYDLQSGTVSAILDGAGALTKISAGNVTLSGANNYSGATSITGGVLNIRNASALGTTAGATFVSSGAALELQGDISVGAEALTLSGTGVSNAGALRNISGANTYGGLLSLGAASRINSDAGTLTLSNAGTITGATFGLTVGGAGNTTINSIIGTTSGTLTKDETGTLILTAANTFTGLTSITGGVLNMRNASALGTTAGATFVSSGAALELQGGLTIGAEALTLNGSGVSSGGALRSVSGTNSFGGAITADSASTITADAGSLTLSSTLNSAFATTFGGAGNIIMAGSLSGVGNIIKSGNGALTLAAGNSQANTTVNAGQLNVNHLAALGTPAGTLTMASGTSLDNTSGASVTVTNPKSINLGSSLTFVGSNNLNLGNGLVTLSGNTEINVAANQLTFGGDLLGSGNIEKTGAGILALGGFSADYSGIITMSAGDLMLTAANILNKAVINQTGGKVIIGGGTPQERLEVFLPKISGSGGEILVGSDTVAVFNSDDDLDDGISQSYSGRIRGSGGIRKQGSGLVTLNGKNDFTGQADIDGGTLLIHEEGELGGPAVIANNAVLVVNGATSGTVEVEAGGTLAGAGVVGGFVIIKGIHSPGNSPGVQTFANGASYDGTSVFEWDLVKNFSNPTGRGTFYDGVNVTAGQLLIAADSQSSLRFNREGSTVNWSNSFWTTDQQWLVFDNASAPSEIFGAPSLTVDSEGATLASLRPGATFSWGQVGNDIYLNYTVPEPSSALFTIAGVLGLSLRRRR
jgi:autotransporter-associated beta strand protein